MSVCDSDKRKGGYYKAAIITAGIFTKEAREKADGLGIYLRDGKEFQRELAKVRKPTDVVMQTHGESPSQSQKEKTNLSKILSERKILIISSVVIGTLVLLIAGQLISRAISTAQQKERFTENVNLFLLEGGKLNAMTEQGVTNSDYRDQLASEKSTFRIARDNWLPSLSSQQIFFEEAIEGWELALEVWDYDRDSKDIYLVGKPALLREAIEYTGEFGAISDYTTLSDWVSIILTVSSNNYEMGQRLLNLEMN